MYCIEVYRAFTPKANKSCTYYTVIWDRSYKCVIHVFCHFKQQILQKHSQSRTQSKYVCLLLCLLIQYVFPLCQKNRRTGKSLSLSQETRGLGNHKAPKFKRNCEVMMRWHLLSAYFYALTYSSISPLTESLLLCPFYT